jgi:pyridoxal phosphate enzyme (YggS family)
MTTTDRREAIKENLAVIRGRIADAARKAGRSPEEVTLTGATKGVPAEVVTTACELGVREFGENWVQEAEPKIAAVKEALQGRGEPVRWHMIGHLQRNKAKEAIALFDVIDTVDSLRLAEEIEKRAKAVGKSMPVLLEIDYTDQDDRGGFRLGAQHDKAKLDAFFHEVEGMVGLSHVHVEGLMTVAPMTEDPEGARPAFRRLRELRDALNQRFPEADFEHLSMGMTHDYLIAIQEGATVVRLGTAIFGARPPGRTY